MSRGDPRHERTSEERERDRLERERRRALRRGESPPPLPPPAESRAPHSAEQAVVAEPPFVEEPPFAGEPPHAGEPSHAGEPPVIREPLRAGEPPVAGGPAPGAELDPPVETPQAPSPAAGESRFFAEPSELGSTEPAADPTGPQFDQPGAQFAPPTEQFAPLEAQPAPTADPAPVEPPADAIGADELFAPPADLAAEHAAAAEPTALEQPQAPRRTVKLRRGLPPVPDVPSASGRGRRGRRAGPAPESGPPGRPGRSTFVSEEGTSRRPHAPRIVRGRLGALAALALVLVALWFLFSLFQPLKGGGSRSVVVEIPKGSSTSQIGDLLAKDGVVSSSFFFNLRATISGDRGSLKSGRYQLKRDMSYGSALSALTSQKGQPLTTRVTVPEGASRREESVRVAADGIKGSYLSASVHSHLLSPGSYGAPRATRSLEGFLFPATYEVLPGAKASVLVNQQLAAFKQNFAHVDLAAARKKHLTAYDVLIIASMVEREAQLAKERPLIAAVIFNRLKARMPLGIDATIRYAIGDYTRPLTAADLKLNSPYNTRRRRGLPPTPIGSPGLASINAAAHPAAVSYLYYVVKPNTCGEHAFSSSYAQFLKDAAQYNSARAAKGGRAPTKC